eukprot:m.1004458 g.1004458  ORF g.1004458 m.1004458 type:complete len:137 (+) comp24048_c0_seq29:1664-2074(+)
MHFWQSRSAESADDQAAAKAAFKSAYANPDTRKVIEDLEPFLQNIQRYGHWCTAIRRDLNRIKRKAQKDEPGIKHFVNENTGYIIGKDTRLLKKILVQPLSKALKSIESDFSSALSAFEQTGTFGINVGEVTSRAQ